MPTIWVDADAAPRDCKDVLYRAAERRRVQTVFVANQWQQLPRSPFLSFVRVGSGFDVADDHIAAECADGDLVVTADIPLAAEVVDKGAEVLHPRGEMLDPSNIKQRLTMRNHLEELRGAGVTTGGPPPYGPKDKQRFANALDRWLTRHA
ncbi:MAG: hypothetical protein ACI8PZ_004575 [Myxococcota bacterium]|jgi:uncharacterized protein YaiI (UPF0178 family)